MEHRYAGEGDPRLRYHRGTFYEFDGRCWPEKEPAALTSELYQFLDNSVYAKNTPNGPTMLAFRPDRKKVAEVTSALGAFMHLPSTIGAPAWLDGEGPVPADEVLVVSNGALHLPSRRLLPHSSRLFTHHAAPFAFEPGAPPPTRWIKFLNDLWPDDRQSVETLQEVFGYLLTPDTALQKMFLIVGPKRSGKGTIARVLRGLLGAHAVAAPTLASLATNFGLQPLIDRPLAIIGDARVGGRSDPIVVERLLTISGEDTHTIDRKYREPWTGKLPTRILILSNELPHFCDNSGALASRFVVLGLTENFYGREDPGLSDKLLAELPGILNWSLDGLGRLGERGHFVQPSSGEDSVRALEDLGSPTGAFVHDCCDVGRGLSAPIDDVWRKWNSWCSENGHAPGTIQTLGRDLKAVLPGLRTTRPRSANGSRERHYEGIAVRTGPQTNALSSSSDKPPSTGEDNGKVTGQRTIADRASETAS